MKAPGLRVPVALLAIIAAPLTIALAQTPPPLAVFDLALGATQDQVRALGPARNHPASSYSQRMVRINNLPGTEHVSVASSRGEFEGRIETFAFHFTGPPGVGRAWSGGTDQTFGRSTNPSPQAPSARDVAAALASRYGPPAYKNGTLSYWFWDINGHPMRAAVDDNCSVAIAKAPGETISLTTHSAVGNPEAFQLARRGGCAYGVRAEVGTNRGLVYRLATRMVDFKAGQNAWVLTSRHVATLGTAADQERSRRNRPAF